jgi:hypothetical protein
MHSGVRNLMFNLSFNKLLELFNVWSCVAGQTAGKMPLLKQLI